MSIKRWIRNWLLNENATLSTKMSRADVESSQEHGAQISINEAMNGRVLTIRTYRPNNPQYGNNWTSELYVLKDGESLTEVLTMLLTLKGIDK
jgi:hypothetical protein